MSDSERESDDSSGSLLVTGGTGFLGLHTCQYFRDQGWDVTAFDLKPFEPNDDTDGIEFIEGDVRSEASVADALEESDATAVVHTAAALPLWDADRIRETTIDGTRNVLWAANDRDVERVCYVSSTAVYGTHDTHPITEESPLDGVGPYGEAKIEAEKVCQDFRRMGMCVPIVRPKTFVGPQRLGVFQVLFDWIEDGANVPLVGWGNNRYQLLHVHDLVTAIELLLTEDEESVNDTFNVGTDEFGTMKEDFQAPIDYAGTGKRTIGTPAFLTVAVLRVLDELNLSPLYPWVYETAHEDSYVSVEKLKGLGWEPEYSNREALVETYEWYLENYEADEEADESGLDHRVAWDQGALAVAKKVSQRI
ncbi:NAD-dependent epimerase/dehydratase [Haloterrigena turkmenica DSM 5511]|uniref:NAD-dependent epimerase/dehydratase n=1 Tax=Haloterrigena turkmenica (strain ATCC 51198 / DSM 5511 / JCM 9101 / NCIMB 13204 / VKM B-1734 / 4k) TaxID=543526 RepID=D2RQZ2_HALTV|nr:NAD-dependent epimerase/dehydratase family protein [Haloterrigena turkmenica]ADB62388.1 NAD-dependent epimerase/dehydratase [Haloterrigena turkmenica DSM 5511]